MSVDFSNFGTPLFFDQFTTRRLMIMLTESRKSGRYWVLGLEKFAIPTCQIKAAMSKRENLLTKQERRKIRQQKARQKRNR